MTAWLNQWMTAFNKRSERERLLMTVVLACAILLIWVYCLVLPVSRYAHNIQTHLSSTKKNVAILQELNDDFQTLSTLPDDAVINKIRELENKLAKLQKHPLLAKTIIQNPADMKKFMQAISQTGPTMSLGQIQTLPPITLQTHDGVHLQSQPITIELHGDYFETIHYLTYLEHLPWYIAFNNVNYDVEQYPNAKVTIALKVLTDAGVDHHS